jgi:hypothetical protein
VQGRLRQNPSGSQDLKSSPQPGPGQFGRRRPRKANHQSPLGFEARICIVGKMMWKPIAPFMRQLQEKAFFSGQDNYLACEPLFTADPDSWAEHEPTIDLMENWELRSKPQWGCLTIDWGPGDHLHGGVTMAVRTTVKWPEVKDKRRPAVVSIFSRSHGWKCKEMWHVSFWEVNPHAQNMKMAETAQSM